MSDNFDKLINKLEEDLEPVKPIATALQRSAIWFFGGVFSVIIIGALIGFRMDLSDKITDIYFVGEIFFLLFLCFAAAYASALLSLPDCGQHPKVILIPYAIIILVSLIIAYQVYMYGFHLSDLKIHHCVIDAFAMGSIPVFLMIWMMRKGATTHPFLMALTNMIAAGCLGYLGLRLSCGSSSVGHVCTYHIIPFVFAGLLLGLIARKLYRW